MTFAEFPFLRYFPFVFLGFLLEPFLPSFPSSLIWICLGLVWAVYAWNILKSSLFSPWLSSSLGYFLLFLLGLSLGKANDPVAGLRAWPKGALSYIGEIQEMDQIKEHSFQNVVRVIAIRDSLGWKVGTGNVLIYHQIDRSLQAGEIVWIDQKPEIVSSPSFPHEFDYRLFLARKGIHFRQFVGKNLVVLDSSGVSRLEFSLSQLRQRLSQQIQNRIHRPESQQIAQALLLGQKQSLDPEMEQAYADTGTLHILAVSGLHVGIIYAVLLIPISFFSSWKQGKNTYLLFVIALIWLYALITGFSPSVIRAAGMFTLLTAGQMRRRKPSIWNVLACSALVMLVLDPLVIFDLGFQLSYLAVAGIVGLQPLLLRFWLPNSRVLEYFWQMITVTVAAQLATSPLTIYHFHTFPSYFLLANLILVPLSFLTLYLGVPFLILSWVPGLGYGLGWLLDGLIFLQNEITYGIHSFPGTRIEGLSLSSAEMGFLWFLMGVWILWQTGPRKKMIYLSSFLWLFLSLQAIIKEVQRPSQEVFFYSSPQGALIDLRWGQNYLSWNQDFPILQLPFSIAPNRRKTDWGLEPTSLKGVSEGNSIYFPGLEMHFFPEKDSLVWGSTAPTFIQEFLNPSLGTYQNQDSLAKGSFGFHAVFFP